MSSFVSRARGDAWHTLGGVVFGRISRIYRGERPPLLWVLLGQGLRADKGVSGALFHPGVCGVGEVGAPGVLSSVCTPWASSGRPIPGGRAATGPT